MASGPTRVAANPDQGGAPRPERDRRNRQHLRGGITVARPDRSAPCGEVPRSTHRRAVAGEYSLGLEAGSGSSIRRWRRPLPGLRSIRRAVPALWEEDPAYRPERPIDVLLPRLPALIHWRSTAHQPTGQSSAWSNADFR